MERTFARKLVFKPDIDRKLTLVTIFQGVFSSKKINKYYKGSKIVHHSNNVIPNLNMFFSSKDDNSLTILQIVFARLTYRDAAANWEARIFERAEKEEMDCMDIIFKNILLINVHLDK